MEFCVGLEQDAIFKPLISQTIRSVTGIGANYMEANGASPPKDFKNKICIFKKGCGETKCWLRILIKRFSGRRSITINLWKECQESAKIFQKIIATLRKKEPVLE